MPTNEPLECPYCDCTIPQDAGGCSCGRDRDTLRNLSDAERRRARYRRRSSDEMSEGEAMALGRYFGD